MKAVLIALVLLAGGGAAIPAQAPVRPVEKPATLLLGFTDGTCSGTAVASQLLLSASHCFGAGALVAVNGKPCKEVGKPIKDGNDHSLVMVTCQFDQHATLGGPLYQGQEVHFYGNPAVLSDIYRRGYVMGFDQNMVLIDAMVERGDSGSGIFDRSGRIVGVVSTRWAFSETFHGMGARPMKFTREQLSSLGL